MTRPTAVVSGATSGIGKAIALRLADGGYDVLALGTNAAKLRALEKDYGLRIKGVDIADADLVMQALEGVEADLLVHAAGVLGTAGKVYEITAEAAADILGVNVMGTVSLLRALVPSMVERRAGYIILLGSVAGRNPGNGPALYSASKAAVSALAAGLRNDLHGTGVRVTEIQPGRVNTGMHRQLASGDFYHGYQCLEADDIASTVAHLVSLPPHVDVSQLEILPTDQTLGGSRFRQRSNSTNA
ncbi:SDR family oxidoreductase [Pararhizobium polonicum]|uniref:SDR family oxidoreductase n=1 Tax=Pararhizobium polonicum TaxID=1612624 RepID=UPI001314363B|nr:SDR family oxidoreductase [Pararhizobium polonicum]